MDDPEDTRAYRGTNGRPDKPLSGIQYKRDKCNNEGRAFRTKREQETAALNQLCQHLHGGKVTKERFLHTRQTVSKGLDKRAMAFYADKVNKITGKADPSNELVAMAAGADFMPMISETVSMRYSCRRSECRMIPLRENQ